jgi:hypothetical protein
MATTAELKGKLSIDDSDIDRVSRDVMTLIYCVDQTKNKSHTVFAAGVVIFAYLALLVFMSHAS